MALFDIFKKKKEGTRFEKKQREKVAEKKEEIKEKKEKQKDFVKSAILVSPRVTEKSTILKEQGAYVFKVGAKANKIMVKRAIKEAYGVSPAKVNIINSPSKKRFVRGRHGVKAGFKKAVVYLKKGDKIEA